MSSIIEVADLVPIAQAINVLYVFCDISIAIVMVYLLRRSQTGLRSPDSVINKLVSCMPQVIFPR
jgi:hypothetical protein